MPKKTHYIDNKRFEVLIQEFLDKNKDNENELMDMFQTLISNIIVSFGFQLSKEDAVQDCFVLILKTLKNFNRSNGTAFNFFTTIIINNLKYLYTKDKKYKEKIEGYKQKLSDQIPNSSHNKGK